MSYVDKSLLRGILDPNLSFYTTTRPFTTSQVIIDALADYGSYIRTFLIVNQDNINQLTYRQAAPTAPAKTLPMSSEREVQGWESYLEINPNAISGTGYIELELVKYEDALKPDLAKAHKELVAKQVSEQSEMA